MNEFTPLIRPLQSQIAIDSVAKECPSSGFEYPTFRQLAKNVRILLSRPLDPQLSTSYYRLFSIANSKGWFVAVKATPSGSELVFSPLDELRVACEAAKPDDESLYNPKRTLSIPTKANIVAFACGDTKLLVGLEDGSVIIYETASLFTPGTNDVQPLGRNQLQSSPLRQVLPNPGSEQNLSDLFAVVGDGKVQLLDMQLQFQGGWEGSDLMTQPIAVDWSPKGKHIAIGLQTGDILTFSLTNKSTPHKHIPPTVNSLLVSLNWLAPGHTFRTSYEAVDGSATQHIIVLDTKSTTATYFSPDHPFLSGDRKDQAAYVLNFPKWDADPAANDENKYLTIVADLASVDLEVLGNIGNQWFRQSQDNPLTLPLDNEMNDTVILGFQADLTDSRYDSPIMYAYLNDGSLQGWYVEHTKPYPGMMNGKSLGSTNMSSQMSADTQEKGKDTDMGGSTLGQVTTLTDAFGQSIFGQQAQSPFGRQNTSTFGQTGFGQQSSTTPSSFGQAASASPAFGQSSFGQPSAFGALSSGFGQSNQPSTAASGFSSPTSGSGFGAFAGASGAFSSGAFGSGSTPNAFSGLGSNSNTSVFGQGIFGSNSNPASVGVSPSQPAMTREASMSDSTPGFGGMSLGSAHPSDASAVNSMFGAISTTPSSNTTPASTSAFGGSIVKPASGAFGNFQVSTTFGSNKPATTVSAFAPIAQSQPTASPAFGQSGFGQPSFGQTSFGKPSFGAAPASGAFGTTGNASQQQKPAATSGGFSAFASTPTTFGTALGSTTNNAESKPATGGGFSSFGSATPSAFGTTTSDNASKQAPSSGGGFNAFASNAPSAFGSTADGTASNQTSNSGGFSSFASATSAFGSTDSSKTSVFGNVTKESSSSTSSFGSVTVAESKPRTSVFGTPTASSSTSLGTSGVRSPFGNTRDDSPTGSPKDPFDNSPPSSPESKPVVVSPFGQSTTPAPSSGAFGNIQVTPSAFKPASGFGAFGSLETPKGSAFFKKPDETPPPVSAFGSISTTPKTPSAAASTPTFGSPSVLGGVKSAYAPIVPMAETPTKAPTSGGFGAFSGSSTGFSAFAGPKTSFTDLLKSGGEEAIDPVKSSAPVFSKPETDAGSSKPRTSVSEISTTPKQDKPSVVSAFPPIAKAEIEVSKPSASVSTPTTTPKPAVVSAFPPTPKTEGKESTSGPEKKGELFTSMSKPDDKKSPKIVQGEPSYGNLSVSSAGSSFVEVEAEEEEPDESDREDDGDGGQDDDEDGVHSDSNSFLSDNLSDSSYKDGDSVNDESDGEELPKERNTPSPEPPLPVSRSPSATPQPEIPTIEVSASVDDDKEESSSPSPKASPVREPSTTLPSTPVKEPKSLFGQGPSLATPSTPSSSPFGLGLGRPSTRPTRSSPLANAVSVEEEEEEKTKSPPKPHPAPVSPRPVYGVLPVDEKAKGKQKDEPAADPSTSNKRPKTPPLLSTMGPPVSVPIPKTPVLAPAVTPGSKTPSTSSDTASSKSSSPAPISLGFGSRPAEAVSTPNLFGTGKPAEGSPFGSWSKTTPSKPELPRAQTAPAAPSPFGGPTTPGMTSLFGTPPPGTKSPTPAFSMPPFSLSNTSTAAPLFPPGAPSLFGSKSPPITPSAPSLFGSKPTSPPSTGSFFAPKQTGPSPASTMFGSPPLGSIQPPASPPFSFGSKAKATPPMAVQVQSPPKPSPTAALEEGMQKECANLVIMLNEDLATLADLALVAKGEMASASKSAGGSRFKKELSIASKWSLGDLNQFAKVLLQYEADLDGLESYREKQKEMIRELHGSMLKCGTRKEEIARFNKARTDKEFAKMLKSRTLGPEHTETQTRLRKDIRAIRDRVEKLETRLQENKKKLAQAASCKPTIKAPSLDTINRTYRNIEIAIDQQADEVSRLASRIAKLNVKDKGSSPALRDARLPDIGNRRAYNVTPNVAARTAAALNAERSANRLKKVLLSVRKEPLLNTKAEVAPSAPISFKTPKRKSSGAMGDFAFQTPISGSLFAEASAEASPAILDWNLPEDNFNPTETPALAGRRGATGQRKHPSVPLKRSSGTAPVAPPTDFQWGPLPSFATPPPAKNLPASFVSFSTPTRK